MRTKVDLALGEHLQVLIEYKIRVSIKLLVLDTYYGQVNTRKKKKDSSLFKPSAALKQLED